MTKKSVFTYWPLVIFSPISKDIDFEGFQKFLDLFLDCDTPSELSKHLFLSFLRPYQSQIAPGNMTLSCMAAISSNTCMAPVTSHNTRGTFLSRISLKIKLNHVQRHKKGSVDRGKKKKCSHASRQQNWKRNNFSCFIIAEHANFKQFTESLSQSFRLTCFEFNSP